MIVLSVARAVAVTSAGLSAGIFLGYRAGVQYATLAVATRTVSVPLNDQLMTWSPTSPPADLHEIWAPWDRVNTLRSILASAALAFEAVALSTKAASAP